MARSEIYNGGSLTSTFDKAARYEQLQNRQMVEDQARAAQQRQAEQEVAQEMAEQDTINRLSMQDGLAGRSLMNRTPPNQALGSQGPTPEEIAMLMQMQQGQQPSVVPENAGGVLPQQPTSEDMPVGLAAQAVRR